MRVELKQDSALLEKVETLYFNLEELFYEFAETKIFELTPQVVKKLYYILTLYNDVKTELTKTYKIDILPRNIEYVPLTPIFSLIIDALTLVQSLYQELLNDNIDIETLFVLDNTMSRIQRTILFFHYFHFAL